MRALIIHNPKAGSGSNSVFVYQKHLLEQGCNEVVTRITESRDKTKELLIDAEDFDFVVASGGDGTCADIAYHLRFREVPTLIFPSGTANLLSSNLELPSDPKALAEISMEGIYQDFDLGEFMWKDASTNTEKSVGFSMIAGAGYDATMMEHSDSLKENLGASAYFIAALSNPNPQKYHFKLYADGKKYEHEGIAVLIANFGNVTFDVPLTHKNSPLDGLFDIVILKATNTIELLPTVLSAILDRRGTFPHRPQMEIIRASNIKVESEPCAEMQFDGDVIAGNATTPFVAKTLKSASRFLVPKYSKWINE